MNNLSPLDIALIVLAVAGIWAVVELALVFRKTRGVVGELTENVNATLDQVNPLLAKVDGLIDEVEPAAKQVDPLLISAIGAVDSLSKDLDSLDVILGDVSHLTTGAAAASDAAASGMSNAVTAAQGLVGRVLGRGREEEKGRKAIADASKVAAAPDAVVPVAEKPADKPAPQPVSAPQAGSEADDGYFRYPTQSE